MTKIEPIKALEKINTYLQEIEDLKKKKHSEGKESKIELNQKIKTLINLSFDDAKDKLREYKPSPFYSTIIGKQKSEEQKERESQTYYDRGLDIMKNYLIGYKEELELIIETNQQSSKLSKLEEEIKEKKLEAERRKTVVETKVYGAEIEIITILRDELKTRGETAKAVSELNSRINRIEDMLSQILSQKNTTNVQRLDDDNQEDLWHNDIVKKTQDSMFTRDTTARKDAKRHYSQIKLLREEIRQLQNELGKASLPEEIFLKNKLNASRTQLSIALKKLADIWAENS